MNIYDIPDELLYQICKKLDDKTLLNMSQAYSRVYQVCSNIIEGRRMRYHFLKLITTENSLTTNSSPNAKGTAFGPAQITGILVNNRISRSRT